MNFKDRRALETLPSRIAALQTQVAGLNAVLTDPDPSTDGRMERIARVSSVIYEWLSSPE